MTKNSQNILKTFQRQQGFMTFRQFSETNLSYKTLLKLIDQGQIIMEDKGLYRLPHTYLDELFVLQTRFKKGIYTLETALWLHGLSLTIPFDIAMGFPYGTNTQNLKQAGIRPITLRSHYAEGIVELERQAGQFIAVYEIERVLTECLRPIHQVDIQIIAPAFKQYFQQHKVNTTKLFYYAQLFKVIDKLQSYLEVLS